MKSGYPAYEKQHCLDKYYFVFPDLKPEGFRLNRKTLSEVDKKLKENDQLREEVDKLKGKKKRLNTIDEQED